MIDDLRIKEVRNKKF